MPTPGPVVTGLTSPVRRAVSVIDPPSWIGPEAVVVMLGVAGLTMTDSFAALHGPLVDALFASPLKNARQR